MNPYDIEDLVEFWENIGLVGIREVNGVNQWLDFCVVEGLFGGPTAPCEWLTFDQNEKCVYLKGSEKGKIVGRI